MRLLALLAVVIPAVASADAAAPPMPTPAPAAAPRWRFHAALLQGFGGGRDGADLAAVFPTTLAFGARVWGPLSVDVAATGVLATSYYVACGSGARPHAALGSLGVRADLFNRRDAPWIDPYVEAHAAIGGQWGAREEAGHCPSPGPFASGGARLGLDAWLGRAAVTVAVSYDWLPTAAPFAFELGATFLLY